MAEVATSFFQDTYVKIFRPVDEYVVSTVSTAMGQLAPWVTSLMILYVMIWGIAMLMGNVKGSLFMDGVRRTLRLVIVAGFAMSTAIYNDFILDVFWKMPDELARVFNPQPGSGSVASIAFLDQTFDKFYDVGNTLYQKGSITSSSGVGSIIMAFFIWIAGLVLVGLSFLSLVVAKISLALLMAVGFIFIALSLFEATKQYLDVWLKFVATNILVFLFTVIFIGLVIKVASAFADSIKASGDTNMKSGLATIIFAIAAVLYYATLATKAAGMGGGVASGVSNFAQAAFNKAMGSAKGVSQSGSNLLSGKTLNEARGQRRRSASNKAWAAENPGRSARATQWAVNKMRPNSVKKSA